MKAIIRYIATAAALAALLSCSKEDGFIQREETAVSFDCLAQSIEQNLLAKGDWFIDVNGVDWVTVSPMKGTGNGEDYQMYTISVAYNKGGAREGTIYVCQGDTRCPVTVSQGRCKFGYTGIAVQDTLYVGKASAAGILVNYEYAAGDESVTLTTTLSGTAASGITAAELETSDFHAGTGSLYIPIEGTPKAKGTVSISVMAGKKYVGECTTEIVEYVEPTPDPGLKKAEGLPVGWNFFAAGLSGTEPRSTEAGKYWTIDEASPRVYPTSGKNPDAVLHASIADGHLNPQASILSPSGQADAYYYNCAMQINGMLEGDSWVLDIPVCNFTETTKISVEAAVSTASKGVGYYIMEYSADGTKWFEAPGATSFTKDSDTFKAHFWNTVNSTANKGKSTTGGEGNRKSYDKETDNTYHKYVFQTSGIEINDGMFYLRLRALKYKYDLSGDVEAAWTDLKGIELDFVED